MAQAWVGVLVAATESITMPEPITCTVVAATAGSVALSAAERHVGGWFRTQTKSMKLTDMEEERVNASEHLRKQGWHCTTCPCLKLMQVLPQKDLMDILQDPIFQNSAPLKKWMEQQLKQVSRMTPGCDDLKNETVQSEKSEDDDGTGKFSAIMAVLFARVDESTKSPYAQETSQEVCDRLKDLGSNFHPIADLLKADGIDGHFLAHNDISRECLADDYCVRRKIQQDALLSHFGKYKATTPNVAIGLVACSAEIAHRWGHWTNPRHMSHEDLKVRAQKMMTYQSASKLMDEAAPSLDQSLDQSSNAAPSLDQSSNAAPSMDQSSNGFEVVDSNP